MPWASAESGQTYLARQSPVVCRALSFMQHVVLGTMLLVFVQQAEPVLFGAGLLIGMQQPYLFIRPII
jgi:hypothetical protein